MIVPGLLVVSEGVDALSQDEQRGVYVSRLFQTLPDVLGLSAAFGPGQVAQTQPDGAAGAGAGGGFINIIRMMMMMMD